jgi:hypothetical protein
MLRISYGGADFSESWLSFAWRRGDRTGLGLLCSTLLHLAVALLLVFGPNTATHPPPEIDEAIPAELVQQGETAAPIQGPDAAAALPSAPVETPRPAPAKPAEGLPLPPSRPAPLAEAPPPTPAPQPPKPRPGPRPVARSETEPQPPPEKSLTPPDLPDAPFTEFKSGQTIERNDNTRPSPSVPGNSAGTSRGAQVVANAATTGGNPGAGRQATYDVKDYVRAQVMRHWEFDTAEASLPDPVVSVHVVLNPDGSVALAQIVPDNRYVTDPVFRALAISARDAVLVSSPLHLPPGTYEANMDMVLVFDARKVLR